MKRLLTFLLLACSQPAVWAQYESFTQKGGFLSLENKIDAFFFNAKTHRLVIRDEGSLKTPKYGSLEKAMTGTSCVAGINGGFFGADQSGTPLGIVVQNGATISKLATGAFTVAGIVYDTGTSIHLQRSKTFAGLVNGPKMKSAIQGGPFLVENAQTVDGLDARKSTYRTFIATDGQSGWCIGVTSPMTLKELSQWLARKGALGKFTVKTALNLDGGTSSAFWCKTPALSYPSLKKVRNYIGVQPVP